MNHFTQVMRRAARWACAKLAPFGRAPMDCCVQTTYATNRPTCVKTLLPIAPNQMIHVLQNNALNLLVGANSLVVPLWKHGRTLKVVTFLT